MYMDDTECRAVSLRQKSFLIRDYVDWRERERLLDS